MKTFSIVFSFSLFIWLSISCQKKISQNTDEYQSHLIIPTGDERTIDFITDLENNIPKWLKKNKIPGALIAVIHKGQPIWYGAFGYADTENKIPINLENICRVESISKSVTAWGILKLVQDGLLDLDEPVTSYLKSWSFPPSKYSTNKITIRHLLTHSSGLKLGTIGVRYPPNGKRPTLHSALTKDAILFQEPGHAFSYSNVGFNLLELVVEEVTGMDFSAYMKDEILIPIGMIEAGFGWEERFKSKVPNGYDLDNHTIPPYVYPDRASGGMFASIKDVATFTMASMPDFSSSGLNVLHKEIIYQMYEIQVPISGYYSLAFPSYGLGHFLENLSNDQKAISHGGQGSGWMTHFHSIPESGEAIIILTNSQRSWPFFAYLLTVWGDFLGVEKVGMSVILIGHNIIWIMLIIIGTGSLLALICLLFQWKSGSRNFNLLGLAKQWTTIILFFLGWLIIGILIWANLQPYLFIEAVFPGPTPWLGRSLLLLAITLILVSVFPKKRFSS